MAKESIEPGITIGWPFPEPRIRSIYLIPLACEPNDVVVCTTAAEFARNAEIYGVPKWLHELAFQYLRNDEDAIFHLLIDRRLYEHLK